MSLGSHLDELRKRIIVALIGLLPIAIVCFYFGTKLLAYLQEPLNKKLQEKGLGEVVTNTPGELFAAYMKVSFIATIVLGLPWVLFQLWRFVSPGLHRHEKRFIYFLIPLSSLLTAGAMVFLFRVALPIVLSFLIDFGVDFAKQEIPTAAVPTGTVLPTVPVLTADPVDPKPGEMWVNQSLRELRIAIPVAVEPVKPQTFFGIDLSDKAPPSTDAVPASGESATTEPVAPKTQIVIWSQHLQIDSTIKQQVRVESYLDFFSSLALAFAAAFQAPVVVLLLGWVGVVNNEILSKFRRHAALLCVVVAAALTPGGDVTSLFTLMVPMYLLYELGGLLLRIFPASRVGGKPKEGTERNLLRDGLLPGNFDRPTTEQEDDRP